MQTVNPETVLMERTSGGVRISLVYALGLVGVVVEEPGRYPQIANVDQEDAMDAFVHPYAYINAPAS